MKASSNFAFEPAIRAFSQNRVSPVEEDIRSREVQRAGQPFFPAPLYLQADFLAVVPICEKLGYTKLTAQTRAVAAAADTSKVRQVEAAEGIK